MKTITFSKLESFALRLLHPIYSRAIMPKFDEETNTDSIMVCPCGQVMGELPYYDKATFGFSKGGKEVLLNNNPITIEALADYFKIPTSFIENFFYNKDGKTPTKSAKIVFQRLNKFYKITDKLHGN